MSKKAMTARSLKVNNKADAFNAGKGLKVVTSKPNSQSLDQDNPGSPMGQVYGGGQLQGGNLKGYKKGGMVSKTGPAKLHKGERVLTTAQAKKMPLATLEKRLTKKGK